MRYPVQLIFPFALLFLCNGAIALGHFFAEMYIVSRYENNTLASTFVDDMATASVFDWLQGLMFFVLFGNVIPWLWIVCCYKRGPGRSIYADILLCNCAALVVSITAFGTLMHFYPTPMRSDVANVIINIVGIGGFAIAQVGCAAVIEALGRIRYSSRFRAGRCVACGHKLARTLESTCSECGASIRH